MQRYLCSCSFVLYAKQLYRYDSDTRSNVGKLSIVEERIFTQRERERGKGFSGRQTESESGRKRRK